MLIASSCHFFKFADFATADKRKPRSRLPAMSYDLRKRSVSERLTGGISRALGIIVKSREWNLEERESHLELELVPR